MPRAREALPRRVAPLPAPAVAAPAAAAAPSAAHRLLALQRAAGNQAVQVRLGEEQHRRAEQGVMGGAPLPGGLRREMEEALGADFSGVRVSTGGAVAEATAALGARAYALGQSIAFAPGAYDPASRAGRELIGHELAHVVQQRGAPQDGPIDVAPAGGPLEAEADQAGRAAAQGQP